ncbi:C40 family peptidase [Streptomyces sp. NRRL S-350]|uniref:C40 family peptidase n=1 Tax=Streptomyces sp. NRRL S-350 TaxID=1463902 RepID=UPI000689B525|nr:C40 family peptidase [Streptomyces sp. NRRL S-350]
MRIATGAYAEPGAGPDGDPGLIAFEERLGGIPAIAGCGCPNCAARPRTARSAAAGGSRIHRAVRSTCLATSVLAGAGVVGLTAGGGSAHAAAGKQGWDGSRYWFENGAGQWRWTSHSDVYASRTGQSGTAARPSGAGAAAVSNGSASSGPRQGWDGSRYWFENGAGQWRWTSHSDVYASRTGRSAQSGGVGGPGGPGGSEGAGGSGGKQSADRAPAADSTETAVDFALAQLGKPYVWGGNGPSGYDCSGLVQQAYRRSGIDLPRVADDQYAATTPISAGQLRRGDLVFWSDSGRASGIHHVGMYLGGGTFVEAPRPGRTVRVSTLDANHYPTHFGRP